MAVVTFPRQFLVDANGSPRVGAKAHFYESGTTTEITTYTTPAYSVAHANPVESVAGGLFPAVYVNPSVNATYKMVITDSSDVTLYTEDNIPAAGLAQSDIAAVLNPRTDAEIAAGVTPTNKFYPECHAFRYMTSAQIQDVQNRTALVDVRAAIQAAITVAQQIGATVYCPAGAYLIRSTASDDSQDNGIHIPYTHVFDYDQHMVLRGDGRCTVFLAGDNDMTVIRLSDSRTKLVDFSIDANSKTGISGLSLLGSDTASASLEEHIDWNIISGLDIYGCVEGIELESPSAGGCYYNIIESCRLYNNTRHIRLRDNATSFGANRNFISKTVLSGGNTGIWIDGADTTSISQVVFEGIAVGTSPCATPTAIYINQLGSLGGLLSQDTNIVDCRWEDNGQDLDCSQRRTSVMGGNCGASASINIPNGIDLFMGGDSLTRIREIQLGSTTDGLLIQPRATSHASQGQLLTSANSGGSYPFDGDGNVVLQSRQSATHSVGLLAGTASDRGLSVNGDGHVQLRNASFSLTSAGGAATVITNGATIAVTRVGYARVAPAGAVTGIILGAGTYDGQVMSVANHGAGSVTFAAYGTSRVADGASTVIAVNKAVIFVWDAISSGWYSAN